MIMVALLNKGFKTKGNFTKRINGDFYLPPLSHLWWSHRAGNMQCGEGSKETRHKHGEKASEKKKVGLHRYCPLPSLLPFLGANWALLLSCRYCTKETLDLALLCTVYNLFRELLRIHLKAVMLAPSALISRFFKTWTALVVRNLCLIPRLHLVLC